MTSLISTFAFSLPVISARVCGALGLIGESLKRNLKAFFQTASWCAFASALGGSGKMIESKDYIESG